MIKRIINKIILTCLVIAGICLYYLKSPMYSSHLYEKAKVLYNNENYDEALPLFQQSLSVDPKNSAARFMYTQTLSKSFPDYFVQKNLYQIATSDNNDYSKEYARTFCIRLKQKFLQGYEDNYIYNAMQNKGLIRWKSENFPLKVYIEDNSQVPPYYNRSIKEAFSKWMDKTDFIKFQLTTNPKDSDIYIRYEDYKGENCDKSKECKFIVATTYPNISSDNTIKLMNITFYKTNSVNNNYSQEEIYNSALHEIGHALGIMGHSDNPDDIMYSSTNSDYVQLFRGNIRRYISERDLNTINLLYKMTADDKFVNENNKDYLFYAPIILGNEDEILFKKLKELQQYILKYPRFATGYINISSVYAGLGRTDDAFKALDEAQKYAFSQNEKYLIEYNRAVIYYNHQKFQQAKEFALKAKQIKSNNDIEAFIEDINKLLKLN